MLSLFPPQNVKSLDFQRVQNDMILLCNQIKSLNVFIFIDFVSDDRWSALERSKEYLYDGKFHAILFIYYLIYSRTLA